MSYELRPFDITTDLTRVTEIVNFYRLVKITVEDFERDYNLKGVIRRDMVAFDDVQQIVGWGTLQRPPSWPYDRFSTMICVDPAHCNRGIGGMIYDDLDAFAQRNGGLNFETIVQDDQPESVKFAEKRGFVVNRHIFESTLDVNQFDESPHQGVIDEVKASGIDFKTFTELGDTVENRQHFYGAFKRMVFDVPGHDIPMLPFEEWESSEMLPYFSPDGTVFALDGERWIGMGWLAHYQDEGWLMNAFTGVDSAYRGRKIALALKLLNIHYAREQGISQIRTYNDSLNAPMLAINRKLGYQPSPGFYRMKK